MNPGPVNPGPVNPGPVVPGPETPPPVPVLRWIAAGTAAGSATVAAGMSTLAAVSFLRLPSAAPVQKMALAVLASLAVGALVGALLGALGAAWVKAVGRHGVVPAALGGPLVGGVGSVGAFELLCLALDGHLPHDPRPTSVAAALGVGVVGPVWLAFVATWSRGRSPLPVLFATPVWGAGAVVVALVAADLWYRD